MVLGTVYVLGFLNAAEMKCAPAASRPGRPAVSLILAISVADEICNRHTATPRPDRNERGSGRDPRPRHRGQVAIASIHSRRAVCADKQSNVN